MALETRLQQRFLLRSQAFLWLRIWGQLIMDFLDGNVISIIVRLVLRMLMLQDQHVVRFTTWRGRHRFEGRILSGFLLNHFIDQGSLVSCSTFNFLDDLQVLLQAISIANSPKLEDGAEEIGFEFGSAFQQNGLTLHKYERILDNIFKNKISRLFILCFNLFSDS